MSDDYEIKQIAVLSTRIDKLNEICRRTDLELQVAKLERFILMQKQRVRVSAEAAELLFMEVDSIRARLTNVALQKKIPSIAIIQDELKQVLDIYTKRVRPKESAEPTMTFSFDDDGKVTGVNGG